MYNRKVFIAFTLFLTHFTLVHAFSIVEKSIDDIHHAIKNHQITCREIVTQTLNRIDLIDSPENDLNIFISVNREVMKKALELDRKFKRTGILSKLHCIPVAVKDNINTNFLPTTGGALRDARPTQNAFIINQILNADGLIIGKANLHEYALGFQGYSLLGGQTRNVYNQDRGPGGSSSGTAAAVAASLATVGIGTDTGGSIRIPSSNQSLVGLRPSLRLISQSGIMPLAPFQDTAGPLCRKARDCAIIMDVITQYDQSSESNQRSSFDIDSSLISSKTQYDETFTPHFNQNLDENSLAGAKIAVVTQLFGEGIDRENQKVQELSKVAIKNLESLGASIEEINIDELRFILTEYNSVSALEFASSFTRYLQSWPSNEDSHPRSFQEVYTQRTFDDRSQSTFDLYNFYGTDHQSNPEYYKNTVERPQLVRPLFRDLFKKYDALIYPTITGLPGRLGESPTSSGPASKLSAFTGFPAITMPIGYSEIDGEDNLPVGLEFLGAEFDEMKLLNFVHAYQQKFMPRLAPRILQ